ncbi:MAG: hypothetical protein QM323_03235 [Acidobacteriota bacterium]|nr:hypothetical protein [Acidobacteriota bacterium]
MISQPVFFPRGDGRRVLAECLERAAQLRPEAEPLADELRRYGADRLVRPRLGQSTFRLAVTGAYGACAVSGEHTLPPLEATYMRPYAEGGAHVLPNGLLLRADIQRLYDAGYVTVTPDHRLRVSRDLVEEFHNGCEYERFAGRTITVPNALTDQPDPDMLDRHAQEVFRG